MQTVHLRITDAATGKPTPVRLRLTGADGRAYAPLGRPLSVPTGSEGVGGQVLLAGRACFYIDGACEVRLPPGPLTIEASKGLEYSPLVRQVTLAPGQLALRFAIERWADWREQGWYAGDLRAHELSPHAALLEGAAEGLAVVQLLARDDGPHLLAFSGDRPCLRADDTFVAVNTLNTHPALGTVGLLHAHRPVFPLRAGPPDGDEFWSVADWCDQCHRKKGLVTWPDLPRLTEDRPQAEALAALVLGKIDAFEIAHIDAPEPAALADYHALLACGLRPALVGASGKDSNRAVLGASRTYARLADAAPLTPDAWTEAVRAGRTFATTGPLLSLTAAGAGPGDRLSVEPGRRVALVAEASSTRPFDHLELLANGQTIATKPASGNRQSARLEAELTCDETTWVAAWCYAEAPEADGHVFAHTTPVFLDVPGRPAPPPPEALARLLAALESGLRWVESAPFAAERWRRHVHEVLTTARARLHAAGGEGA